jgi:hypothetical protein
VIVAVIYGLFIYWEISNMSMEQLKYDISIVTAADYTVELEISEKMFKDFKTNFYDPKGAEDNKSVGLYLKEYLKSKIEFILNRHYNI